MDSATVLDLPRWRPLASFVGRFYRAPLEITGASVARVEAAELRIGRQLPKALREWFLLAGERFADVNQDQAVRLEQLEIANGRLPVWWENQGNWSFDVLLDGNDDDPWTVVEVPGMPECDRRDRLSRCLFGMTISDTLVGAWGRGGVGPLGPLRPSVVGGVVHPPISDDIVRRVAALSSIDATTNPHFPDPYRGDDALFVRDGGGCFEYLAAGDDAFARAGELFDLARREREEPWVLVVQLASKQDYERFLELRSPDGTSIGRLVSARSTGGGTELELSAQDPDAALAAMRGLLNEDEIAEMRAGAHPQSAVRFRPIWPAGSTSFVRAAW
jgi:hypothetical protein